MPEGQHQGDQCQEPDTTQEAQEAEHVEGQEAKDIQEAQEEEVAQEEVRGDPRNGGARVQPGGSGGRRRQGPEGQHQGNQYEKEAESPGPGLRGVVRRASRGRI